MEGTGWEGESHLQTASYSRRPAWAGEGRDASLEPEKGVRAP